MGLVFLDAAFWTPTRLLDWTEGALIGLYFALRDHDGISDAAIWMLETWWLNKAVIGIGEVIIPGAGIGMLNSDAERYDPWLPERFEKVALREQAVAIYPSHTVPRISTQRSCFTIHGSDRDWLEKFSRQPDAKLSKIIIPASSVREMSRQLALCGVDEVTIYPDLDGLGRFLTSVLKQETEQGDKGDVWKAR